MEMASKKSGPLNKMCPLKPNREAKPSISAQNEKGETVAFCCNGCKNKFVAALPAPSGKKEGMMMAKMDDKMVMNKMGSMGGGDAKGRDSYKRKGTMTKDLNSLRAAEVGDPAPRGHMILQFGGSPRDQIQVSHKEAAVNQVLAMINGYVEKNLVNNKKSVILNKIAEGSSIEEKINLSFLALLQRKPNASELKDFKEMINQLKVDDFHKDIVWALLNSHEFMFVQ